MKCKCGEEMVLALVWDSGGGGGSAVERNGEPVDVAYNLHTCVCGRICREDAWDGAGMLWIGPHVRDIEREYEVQPAPPVNFVATTVTLVPEGGE